jgi:hypothetical protein
MIPPQYDDGFSIDIGHGFVRPMLIEDRLEWKSKAERLSTADVELLLNEPYYFRKFNTPISDVRERHRAGIVSVVLKGMSDIHPSFERIKREIVFLNENANILKLSCTDCRSFATDPASGCVLTTPSGSLIPRKLPPPCEVASCPKGHWQNPITVSTLTKKIWTHYWRMRAMRFNTYCPIMARNWAFIEWVVFHGRNNQLDPFHPGGYPGPPGSDISSESSGGARACGEVAGRPPFGTVTAD